MKADQGLAKQDTVTWARQVKLGRQLVLEAFRLAHEGSVGPPTGS